VYGRDERLGDALFRLPVSEDGAHFWAELSARLAELQEPRSSMPLSQEDSVPSPSVSRSVSIEPASLEEHPRRRARWRNPTMIGAAAALTAVVAVAGAVGTAGDARDPVVRDVKVGTQPTPTPETGPLLTPNPTTPPASAPRTTVQRRYPDCPEGEPQGSEPCTFPCYQLGMAAPGRCVYDPTLINATTTTTPQYPAPPTTAPGSSSPAVPPPAAN
jgi:hypothetical protein